MKATIAVFCFLVLVAYLIAASGVEGFPWPSPHKCPKNETYRVCVSSSCGERRCGEPKPDACTEDCGTGCYCKPRYFRVENGGCVREKDCPKPASPGQICTMPKKTGPCKASIPRFYFDNKAGRCKSFTYGGCEGNQNNFRTDEECKKTCK